MNTVQIINTLYIKNSMVQSGANAFMERIISIFFRNIDFDNESLKTLQEYKEKGREAYVSYQSANTPLLILVNLLRSHNFRIPDLALDFTPNIFQMIVNLVHGASIMFSKIVGRKNFETPSDFDYILGSLRADKAVILSLLSRNLFIRRYIEIKSDTLEHLVDAQKIIDEPIYLFPQILFWNQNPERTRGMG